MQADEAAIEAWLSERRNREATGDYADCKLDDPRRILAGLPQPPRPVTVAGTKGKGSTVRLLESILLAAGHRTVAFASPHVQHLNERWRIDGEDADWDEIAAATEQVRAAEERAVAMQPELGLSYFERSFLVACVLAAERTGAIFLLEVGLGGRLDCANLLDTRLALITHISHDHCAVLGHDIEQIAAEKLAVARPDVPLLMGPQLPAHRHAVARAAARLAGAGRIPVPRWVPFPDPDNLPPIGLPGRHQCGNAALAVAGASILVPELDHRIVERGLDRARLPARCEPLRLPDGRRLLLDGAHNGPSIVATLALAAEILHPGYELILGLAKDKDLLPILEAIGDHAPTRRCGYTGPRARGPTDWPAPADAWPWHPDIATALAACDPYADICVTGSFYLAGETRSLILAAGAEPWRIGGL